MSVMMNPSGLDGHSYLRELPEQLIQNIAQLPRMQAEEKRGYENL